MHRDGHIGLGLAAYAPFAFALSWAGLLGPMLLGLAGVVFASYAPDFDLEMPFVAHRGITHTYLAAVVTGLVYAIVAAFLATSGLLLTGSGVVGNPVLAQVAAGAFGFVVGVVGVGSHLLGDALTPMGIQPKRPFDDRRYSYELVRASNPVANKLLFGGGVVVVVAATWVGTVLRTGAP